jgi:hypothetical protein
MVAAGVALSCGTGLAADPISLDFQERRGTYNILGAFNVDAEPGVVWEVLTDYHHIPKFVGNLKKSFIQEDLGPYHFRLEQEFEGGFLFFTKKVRVVLDVHETWQQTILFTDIDRKDFSLYQGSWNLRPGPNKGLEIDYQLTAKQNFDAPFAGDFMRGGVKDLLDAVRKEILRRQAKKALEATTLLTSTHTPAPLNLY